MPIDRAMIINWALTELGAGAVFSDDDGSDLSMQIENTWQRVVDHVFALHDWSWSRKTVKLTGLADVPINGWSKAFALPGDRIGPPKAFLQAAGTNPILLRNYAIEGATVYANCSDVWATLRRIIEPGDWDAAFRAAFVKALAGALAVPVYQDKGLAQDLMVEAFGTPSEKGTGGMFGRLIAQDMSAEPLANPLLDGDPLTAARTGSGDPYFSWAGQWG